MAQQGRRYSKQGIFADDLEKMMYAFGDVKRPSKETVKALEELLVDYISDLCGDAQSVSTNKGKMKLDDLRFALRRPHQAKQLARVEELLEAQREIQKAKQVDSQPLDQLAKQFAVGGNAAEDDDNLADEETPDNDGPPKKRRKKAGRSKGKERA